MLKYLDIMMNFLNFPTSAIYFGLLIALYNCNIIANM